MKKISSVIIMTAVLSLLSCSNNPVSNNTDSVLYHIGTWNVMKSGKANWTGTNIVMPAMAGSPKTQLAGDTIVVNAPHLNGLTAYNLCTNYQINFIDSIATHTWNLGTVWFYPHGKYKEGQNGGFDNSKGYFEGSFTVKIVDSTASDVQYIYDKMWTIGKTDTVIYKFYVAGMDSALSVLPLYSHLSGCP